MNFEKIIEIIETAVHGFEVQIGVSPNRIVMSGDIYDRLLVADMITGKGATVRQLMGMTVDIVPEKEQFIEVGYMTSAKCYKGGE